MPRSRPATSPVSSRTPRRGVSSRLPQCRTNCPSPPAPAHQEPSQTASSPPAADTAAAAARIPTRSCCCRRTPSRATPAATPRSFPAHLPAAGQRARCRDPTSTLLVAAPSASLPPAISDTATPYSVRAPTPEQSPALNDPPLSSRKSVSRLHLLAILPGTSAICLAMMPLLSRWLNSNP